MQLQFTRRNPVVLAVDNDVDALMRIKDTFQPPYTVVTCESYEEAVATYNKTVPDAVVTELRIKNKSGFDLIKRLNTIDNLVVMAILTGSPTLETARQGYNIPNLSGYLIKSRFDELKTTLEQLVQETDRNRRNFLNEFGYFFDIYKTYFESAYPIRLGTTRKEDRAFGLWLKMVYYRLPLKGRFIFTRDSREGVFSTEPIDLKKDYPQDFRTFTIKRYDTRKDIVVANNNWRKLKGAKIKSTRPWLFYEDMDGIYALIPFITGPNLAQTFQILGKDPDRERASRYTDAIVKVNNGILLKWQELHQKSVRTQHIRESQSEYLTNIRAALDYLRKKAVPHWEIKEFIYSLAGMKDIAPYDEASNATLFSKLMDNAEENSRLELGIVMPSLQLFYRKLPYAKSEPEYLGTREGKAVPVDIFQGKIRERYVMVDTDTSNRISHIFEDLIHLNHAPGAGLSDEQKISRFSDFVTRKFGSTIDTSKLWLAYAVVGLYKSIRKQNRILEVYAKKGREQLYEFLIEGEDYGPLIEDYSWKSVYWGREAKWFASLGHLAAANFREGQSTFASLERLVKNTDMEDYMGRLNDRPASPKLTEKSTGAERMLVAYRFCDKYLIPQSIVL